MLSMVWNPLKSCVDEGHGSKKRTSFEGLCKGSVDQGLRTLISVSHGDSNVVVKSGLKLIKPIFLLNQTMDDGSIHSCFLKSCFLCNKTLSLDKEVYMYRGDQGFCSIKCRDRQIYLNEMRELESSTKKILASFRPCRGSGRWETTSLLEELEQRHKPSSRQKRQVIFS